jgi:hypothetical protein
MFVRFRERHGRLLVSLAATRRIDGRPRQEHIADLGSIDIEPSAEARIAFWRRLHERLGRLSNRVDAASLGPILGAVNARIPMVGVDELPAAHKARAERSLCQSDSQSTPCNI